MEFKGTKGEWKSVYLPKSEYITERYEVQFGIDGECIAEFVHNEYDAKLIASSPDLLEALQYLKSQINLTILPESVEEKINKAIEKALL